MTVTAIVIWIVTGLVIGAVAHLIMPGHQRIGILLTIVIGMVGSLVGGFLTNAVLGAGHTVITYIVALVLAVLLILALEHPKAKKYYRRTRRRTRRARRR
jgi:uncharacterized membrane protein YeaQ/YmgE (transglycosylase-associated protein family)